MTRDRARAIGVIAAAVILYILAVDPHSNPWVCLGAAIGAAICSGLCGLWLRRQAKER